MISIYKFIYLCCFVTFILSSGIKAKEKLVYTGVPDSYVELLEMQIKDIDGTHIFLSVNDDFRIQEISIRKDGNTETIKENCLRKIFFPDLQSVKIIKSLDRNRVDYTKHLKLEFLVFDTLIEAKSKSAELEDFELVLNIVDGHVRDFYIYKNNVLVEEILSCTQSSQKDRHSDKL